MKKKNRAKTVKLATQGRDHPAGQAVRRPTHLRQDPQRHDVRSRLRLGQRPPVPDGCAASHRPCGPDQLPGRWNLNADANQWQNNAYTEADLKRMLKAPAQGSLKEWNKLRKDVKAYVKGINAYIKAAGKDDALLPGEYAAVGQKLKKWKATDVMSVATLFGGIFGRGGGAEVTSAQILRALEARFGVEQGRAIWTGFRSKNNPTAPTTIPESFPYQTGDSFAPKGLALPDPAPA